MTMGLTYVPVSLSTLGSLSTGYADLFLADTGATDSMAPGSVLRNAGIEPIGRSSYHLADGSSREYDFALVQIEFMGEVTAGRVLFGADNVPPLLGATALESAGFVVDPVSQQLRRLPGIPLY